MANESKIIDSSPGHLIRRLQQIAVAIFMTETEKFNITPVQYSALLAINLNPSIDQTALANTIAYDRATIGSVVEKLERKKLIKRAAGVRDRRAKHLIITPNGRRLLREIGPVVETTQQLILAPLRPSERQLFTGVLKRLVHSNNSRSRAPLRMARSGSEVKAPRIPRRRRPGAGLRPSG